MPNPNGKSILLPPDQAVKALEAKGYAIGYSWLDTWAEEHARAFTVAKAMRLDILQDIRRAVDDAVRNGKTFEQFRKEVTPILQAKGWWGRQWMTDPQHPEDGGQLVQLGSPRRLKIIFDTNLRMSRAAGAWARVQDLKDIRPYLRYSAVMDGRTRPLHRAWHGTILPVDDPWWNTHFPPNGWRCRCTTQSLSAHDLKRRGWTVSERPGDAIRDFINRRTGEVTRTPAGIDPGFAYNPGAATLKFLTPAPQSGPVFTPAAKPDPLPDLPVPRQTAADRLIAGVARTEGETAPQAAAKQRKAVEAFLSEFGADFETPAIFTDKIGEPLAVGADFFYRPDGLTSKLGSGLRREALILAADTIKDPDEIWWTWEFIRTSQSDPMQGEYRLRRRYVARYDIDGQTLPMVVVMDVSEDGWRGVTAFKAKNDVYLNNIRGGVLAYRRP